MEFVDAQENLKSGDVKGFGLTNQSEQIKAVKLSRKRHWNQLVDMPDSSSTIGYRVIDDSLGQRGWRPEHREEFLQGIEMFDHDRKYPVWIGETILSSLQHVSAVVDIQAS